MDPIHILGGGLAGSEAAWQVANAGLDCILYEMRPQHPTPAHKTEQLCRTRLQQFAEERSGEFRAVAAQRGAAKFRFAAFAVAQEARVPGGQALTVDREFSPVKSHALSKPTLGSNCGAKKSPLSTQTRSPLSRLVH